MNLFHGTTSENDGPFHPLTHFGTRKAAITRALHHADKAGGTGIWIHEAVIRVGRPLVMRDIDEHSLIRMIDHLHYDLQPRSLRYPSDLRNRVFAAIAKGCGHQAFAKVTRERGYDGFQYENRHEDRGSMSIIIIEPDQAISCGEPVGLTFDEGMAIITDK